MLAALRRAPKEKASVAPAQARAIVRAIEIDIEGAKDALATKNDVVMLRQELDVLRAELRGEMKEFRAELRAEMAKQGGELRAEIALFGFELTPSSIDAIMRSRSQQLPRKPSRHVRDGPPRPRSS